MSSVRRVSLLLAVVVFALVFVSCQRPAEPAPAQPVESAADQAAKVAEANKATAMRFMNEVIAGGKVEVIDQIVDPAFVEHQPVPPEMPKGVEGLKAFVTAFRQAFPDATVTVEHITASDDLVSIHSIWKGTQKGEWMGVKAADQPREFEIFDLVRMKDGKATEHWGMDNMERTMMAPPAKK